MTYSRKVLDDGTVIHRAFVGPPKPHRPVDPEQAARAQHAIAVQMDIFNEISEPMYGRLRGVVFSKDEAGTEYVRICVVSDDDAALALTLVPPVVDGVPIVVLAIGDFPSPTHPQRIMRLIRLEDGRFAEA